MALLDELLVAIGINTDELTSGADGAADDVESSLGGIQTAAAGAAVGGLFISGLNSAMDSSAATSKLQQQLGLTSAEAQRAGDAAGAVFRQGFGESIDEVSESLGSVVSSMGGMSKVSDTELKSMTTSAIRLADVYEIDVADAAQAAGAMIHNGLAKDGAEAFDVLTVAAQNLPKQMLEDIPATVNEYGASWARIGIDAQDAFGLMSQYVNAGGRDIDQAGDVLHEFARITSEETAKASQAFKGLGLNGKEMLADIHKGGEPAKKALTETLDALRNMKDPAKQSALAVQLFGDMAGEGGAALWAMDPATAAASSGITDVKGAADEANTAMAGGAQMQFESLMRTLAGTIGDTLAPALAAFNGFLSSNPELVQVATPIILALAAALGLAAIAQWAMNSALLANPITWIIVGIVALIAAIVLIATKTTWFQTIWNGAWAGIKIALSASWAFIKAVGSAIGHFFTDTIPGWVGAGVNWIKDRWNGLVSFFRGIPGQISRAAHGMWDGLKNAFRSAVNWIIGGWNHLRFGIPSIDTHIPGIGRIGGGSFGVPQIPYLAAGGIATGPTVAMIGEGRESEAVLPLSRLDSMLRSVPGGRDTGSGSQEIRVVIDVTGADSDMKRLMRKIVKGDGGNVQSSLGQN